MKIHAAFDKAAGEAVSVYSVLLADGGRDQLVIAKKGACRPQAAADTVLIVNNPLYTPHDMLFAETDFAEAHAAYRSLNAARLLVIQTDLAHLRPDNMIDTIGQKENGAEHHNIDALHNGHWAVLASCLYVCRHLHNRQRHDRVLTMLDDLTQLHQDTDCFATI